MTLDELAGLLQASCFLPRGEPVEREALRAVPELADGLPPVVFDARGPHVWSGCGEALRGPIAGLGASLVAELRQPAPGTADRRLEEDPLVQQLARLVVEGARHSPGAAVVPLLEVVRAAVAAQGEPGLAALHAGGTEANGEMLGRVAARVQARLAEACARAAESVRVPALAWAIARARLLPLYARGSLDRDPAWARVAAVLGVPLPAGTIEAVEAAVRLAVRGVVERRAAGKATADDAVLVLRALGPARLDPGPDAAAAALLLDPEGLSTLLPTLARFVDAKALQGAGVDAARATSLLAPGGGLAVASVLVEVLAALRTWDVLSQLVAAVGAPPQRAFVVPRGAAARGAVVAVGLGRLRSDTGRSEAAEASWADLVRTAEGTPVAEIGPNGVAVFADAVDALRFALAARKRLDGTAVSVSFGPIGGGTDGATTRLHGPAVESALRWVAGGAPSGRTGSDDQPGLRLRHVGGWLCGDGVALDAAAAEAVQETRVKRGLATAADGPPGGDPRVLRSLDVHRVFEFDGAVIALVRIPGLAGGFEAVHLTGAEWRELLDRDGERTEAPSVSSSVAAEPVSAPIIQAVGVPAGAGTPEESLGWEMAESEEYSEEVPVTLDLEEHTFEAPAPPAAQPRFEFDEEGGDAAASEEVASFSGFYLPSATTPTTPVERPVRLASNPASFDMQVEDDEEETQEWGPMAAEPAAAAPRSDAPRLADVGTEGAVTSSFLDPFAGFTFADEFPVPEELRDPATPASVPRAAPGGGADPFANPFGGAEAPAGADPFAGPAAAPTVESSSDPFSASRASTHDEAFASGDAFAASRAVTAPIPFAELTRDASTAGSGGRLPGAVTGRGVAPLDFDFLLKGYACFFEKREAVFGRPYGTRIVDRHVYPYRGDPDEVYEAFLRDKVQEGFVPRADMIGDLPRGVTVMPLDAEAMQRAWKELS